MPTIMLQPAGSDRIVELRIEVGDQKRSSRFTVHWEDKQAEVSCEMLDDSSGLLRFAGEVFPFYAARNERTVQLWLAGQTYAFEIMQATPQRAGSVESAARSDEVCAPMPGTILKIQVDEGQAVEPHQPLIIMESMKMEMTLSVPHPGRIKRIACSAGQLVEMGQRLIELAEHAQDEASL